MGKKDKKSKTAEKKVRVAQKQEKKASQKQKKAKSKGKDQDSDVEDVDLDAVLAEYANQQEQFLKITESVCDPPPPRSSATIIGSPSNSNELFLYGGEYFNGALAKFYNDLYIYNIKQDKWSIVTSPNSPLPRSGHAWCRGGNAGGIYLFGGEFSSPKQGTFYHYNDFWHLDPTTREWTKLESKGKGPPARSGHRMTYFKQYILLFGGFQDTSQTTKYLQDLWVYDCQTFTWYTPTLPPSSGKPDARSSFSLLPHDGGAALYGGYSRVKASVSGKQGKGGNSSRVILKPMVHQDTWFLRIVPPGSESAQTPPGVRWERRKRPANAPNPPRAGATMAYHKGRGVQFGGVFDVEESEEGMDSEFFNTLFAWNIDRNRYFPLALRRPRSTGKKPQDRSRRQRGKADEDELLRNLAALETSGKISRADQIESKVDESEQEVKVEHTVIYEMPHGRFNAQLAVQDDVLYIFGGTYEKGDREYTFDELWAVDLGKLDGMKQVFKRELEDWEGSDAEESEEEEDEYDESEDEDDTESPAAAEESKVETEPAKEEADEEATDEQQSSLNDTLPHPRPFESLRDFYNRTSVEWQGVLLQEAGDGSGIENKSVKQVRKDAFSLAEEKWWDCREEIRVLEDEQTEAGIGEVVSLADKGTGIGKRR
ncbi:galactose oxidase [Eremomyces bilateralis CBS 781.70]|uniref:Galactose oxidase n=1 Tax=Eremomyces bilateralis CBS 781.70 TaxID=1392243 RepID=A0A6G1FQL1_9PEZI|nr:galactose oxidase [Eremomyces bilateralis CBS 781.70]KAF1808053.1 galactose oxidase [Eremomyces bilateralis CBS 781.70]